MAGRKARVTLTDIAAAAHVSVTTASNVANGRLELMSAPTRDRVEAVMRELNYRPDEGARSLRLAQRRAIGLIIVDDSPRFLADPMNTNILAGFSNYLSVNGFGCWPGSGWPPSTTPICFGGIRPTRCA
jgi:LacI family transcriptional regulator